MDNYFDSKGRARRVPSLEADLAAEARRKEIIEEGKRKAAPAGIGQLAALADKWGTKLKKLCVLLPLVALFASCVPAKPMGPHRVLKQIGRTSIHGTMYVVYRDTLTGNVSYEKANSNY